MPIANASFTVSRTGADLNLNNGTSHQLVQWALPDTEWRRQTVTGRYQSGERLINAVPDVQHVGGIVRCMGGTWADVDAAENEMRLALQQFEYTLTITTASVVLTYIGCEPATIRPYMGRRLAGEVDSCFADFEIDIRCTPLIGIEESSS